MKHDNLAKILQKYQSGWVSISKDYKKVLAWGKTLESLLKKIEQKGNPDGVLMKAAKTYSNYIGNNENLV